MNDARAPRAWWFAACGGAHALLAGLSFEPIGWWPMALAALVPVFLAALRSSGRPARAGLLVSLGVLPLWVYEQVWLIDVAGLWYVLLAVYLAAYPGVLVWFAGAWTNRAGRAGGLPMALVLALGWTALEMLRGEVIWGGYAWFFASDPLVNLPLLAAPAALCGAYFVLFLLALAAAGAAQAWTGHGRARRWGIAAVAASAGLWAGLAVIARSFPSPHRVSVRVALVQTNLSTSNKERWDFAQRVQDFERMAALTREAAATSPAPDLIVWPETMFPGLSLNEDAVAIERASGFPAEFHARLTALQASTGIPMLVGGLAREGLKLSRKEGEAGARIEQERVFNSVCMVRDGRVETRRYDKMELMAFGEVVPYVWRWKGLQQMIANLGAEGWSFDLAWGREPTSFTLTLRDEPGRASDTIGIATPICFEGTMPRVSRMLARSATSAGPGLARPGVLINVTNDGWFGRWRGGREQHLLTMRWRAIETGLPVARCANTGISALILPDGTVSAKLGPWTEGVLHVEIPATVVSAESIAPAAVHFVRVCAILGIAAVVWLLLPARVRAVHPRPRPGEAEGRSS
ncbi:MAG: apolipoprotein N-acyltransferase [Phycisphaerales bacterium]